MSVYLRAKFGVSSIILTSSRQMGGGGGVILPTPPPQNEPLKSPSRLGLRIMNFQSSHSHSSPLFRSNHILKLEDKILIENIVFVKSHLITFLHSLKVGSPSALMFTIITLSHLLLIRYLNHPIEVILMEKIRSL